MCRRSVLNNPFVGLGLALSFVAAFLIVFGRKIHPDLVSGVISNCSFQAGDHRPPRRDDATKHQVPHVMIDVLRWKPGLSVLLEGRRRGERRVYLDVRTPFS